MLVPTTFAVQKETVLSPDAKALFLKWAESIAAQVEIELVIDGSMRVSGTGDSSDVKSKYSLAIQKPHRLSYRSGNPTEGIDVIADGRRVFKSVHRGKKYSLHAAPSALSDLFASTAEKPHPHFDAFLNWFLPAICSQDAKKIALPIHSDVRGVEAVSIDGHDCRQFQFFTEGTEWDLSIEPLNPPLAREMKWRIVDAIGAKPIDVALKNQFKDWNFKPAFEANEFLISPPAKWNRVKDAYPLGR